MVRAHFKALISRAEGLPDTVETDFDTIVEGKEGDLAKQRAYAFRLDATLASALHGHAFFNGKHFDLDDVRCFPKSQIY